MNSDLKIMTVNKNERKYINTKEGEKESSRVHIGKKQMFKVDSKEKKVSPKGSSKDHMCTTSTNYEKAYQNVWTQ